MRCNWQDEKCGLKRGQFYFGREELAAMLGLKEQPVRTVLDKFVALGELTIESNNHGSTRTVVNFDTYIELPNTDSQRTNQQPTSN